VAVCNCTATQDRSGRGLSREQNRPGKHIQSERREIYKENAKRWSHVLPRFGVKVLLSYETIHEEGNGLKLQKFPLPLLEP